VRRANERTQTSEQRRAAEASLAASAAQAIHTLTEEKARAQKDRDALAARLRAGTVRVSVPVLHCGAPAPVAPLTLPALQLAPREPNLRQRLQLALDGIASDGDDAIRELNTCIDRYAAARPL
jgi:prophage endopeptidase